MYPIENYQFKAFEKTNKDGTKSTVVMAMSTFAGKVVKGVAKCMETDSFSLDTGKRLAAARCDLKVCVKRKERALKKREETAKKLRELTQYYDKMTSYYNDALEDALESLERLKTLEKELS